MNGITLGREEIEALTGYKTPTMQLAELHRLGFVGAYIPRRDVVLTRIYYTSVLEQQANSPAASEVAYPAYVPPLHWRQRPEHQTRVKLEREAQIAYEKQQAATMALANAQAALCIAEAKRTAPERRAALVRHHAAKRRVSMLKRTPPWADQAAIRAVYAEAIRLKRETGVEHHVDHVIPLQGRVVSGLHVENNLQVLPWRDNVLKSNRFDASR